MKTHIKPKRFLSVREWADREKAKTNPRQYIRPSVFKRTGHSRIQSARISGSTWPREAMVLSKRALVLHNQFHHTTGHTA